MNAIHFDVNLISKIHYRKSYHNNDYVWREEETVPKYKTFLLIFNIRDGVTVKPAGFYEDKSYLFYENEPVYLHVPDDNLLRCGYQIKEFGNHGGVSFRKEVWTKAYVEVKLTHGDSVGKRFDTDKEALDWIEKLKNSSGKVFEVILNK